MIFFLGNIWGWWFLWEKQRCVIQWYNTADAIQPVVSFLLLQSFVIYLFFTKKQTLQHTVFVSLDFHDYKKRTCILNVLSVLWSIKKSHNKGVFVCLKRGEMTNNNNQLFTHISCFLKTFMKLIHWKLQQFINR